MSNFNKCQYCLDLLNQLFENDSNCEVKSEHYSENDPLNSMSIKLDSSNIKLETEAEPLLYQNPEENMKMITHDHIEENAAISVQETKLQIICPKSTSCSTMGNCSGQPPPLFFSPLFFHLFSLVNDRYMIV